MPTLMRVLGVLLLVAACDSAGQPAKPRGTTTGSSEPEASGMSDSRPPQGSSDALPGASDASTPPTPEVPYGPFATAAGNSVLWKRHAAFEADLMRALELSSDDLCKELGQRNCIRDIHVIALGGNDPFRSGINQPAPRPLSTTSTVVDRVLLSACSARARADKAKPAKVFTELDLAGRAPSPDAPGVAATVTTLYRRLLARDPRQSETALLKTLLDAGDSDAAQSAEEFATLACFAIGSSLEFLFQ